MIRHSILVAAMAFLAGCGGDAGSSGGGGKPPPFDPPPFVQSTSPFPQATGIAVSQTISARFSEAMNALSITAIPTTFTITSAAGPVTGVVTMDPDGRDVYFNPAVMLDFDRLYTATLKSDAMSASGQNLQADHTWTFTTGTPADWQWSEAAVIDTAPDYIGLDIAIDDEDNACAIWSRPEGAGYRIYASRSLEGGAWESPVAVSPAGVQAHSPFVGWDGTGVILATWVVNATVWYSRAGKTGAWQMPQQVTTNPNWPLMPMDMFVDAAGNALLFYHEVQSGTLTDDVYVVRYDVTNEWEAPLLLPTRSNGGNARFAMDRAGFAIAIWNPDTQLGIYSRRYIPGSGWTAVETVDAPEAGRLIDDIALALDGAGGGFALWLKRIAGGSVDDLEMYTSRCTSSGGWTASALGTSGIPLRDSYPKAALSPDGLAVVTGRGDNGDECWVSMQPSGGAWSSPEVIDPGTPSNLIWGAEVHFTVDGRAIFIGNGQDNYWLTTDLWVNEFDPLTGWGTPEVVRSTSAMIGWVIARDADGRAAIAWLEAQVTDELWLSRYR